MYPSTLPCPRMATAVSKYPVTFTSTEFDYGTKRRVTTTQEYVFGWSSVYTASQLQEFRDWYKTINFGTDSFQATWQYEGTTVPLEWRYVSSYIVQDLGNDNYLISSQVESLESFDRSCTAIVGQIIVGQHLVCESVPN